MRHPPTREPGRELLILPAQRSDWTGVNYPAYFGLDPEIAELTLCASPRRLVDRATAQLLHHGLKSVWV